MEQKKHYGKYVIMVDADDSYNILEIMPIIKEIKNGNDLVIGNRYKGKMEKGAIKFSHKYIGTPIISWLIRIKFGAKIYDANCGLRGYDNEKIINLTNENIFAVKFLQIKNGGNYSDISEALRESCPPTRTLEQAQAHINKLWGSAEYKISKLLGVGTVAETYLAKDKSGKEVCVKVLKDGISAEKIATDKEKFLKLIIGDTPKDKLTDTQKYLIRNVNDLAEGISKEVDFKNEMQAAEALRKHCKVSDVAKAIDVKDGIYIMEKPLVSV